MTRLVVMDLDGTLLTSGRELSSRNRDTVRKLKRVGVYACIATGRPYLDAAKRLEGLDLDLPLVTYNGALVRELGKEKTISMTTLPSSLVGQIISFVYDNGYNPYVFGTDSWYATSVDEWTMQDCEETGFLPQIVHDFTPYFNDVIRVSVMGEHEKLLVFKKEAEDYFGSKLKTVLSIPNWLDFYNINVNKANGVAVIQEKLGITPEETMAIGDYYNDLELFSRAGFSVAMENAPEDVRAVSDYVTAANDEDGVSRVFR